MIQILFLLAQDRSFGTKLESLSMPSAGLVEAWHDRRIGAGKDVDTRSVAFQHSRSSCSVSPTSRSDYCYDIEMTTASRA